jgi:hypothetical protein
MPTKNSRQADDRHPRHQEVSADSELLASDAAGTMSSPGRTVHVVDRQDGSGAPASPGSDPAKLRLLPPLSAPISGPNAPRLKVELPRRASDDAVAHRDGRPRFCPNCGESYEIATPAATPATGIVVEFWTSRNRVFHCWCANCCEAFDITDANLVVTEEFEH